MVGPYRSALGAALLGCGAGFVLLFSSNLPNAYAADLTGKTLAPSTNVKSGMEAALGSLLAGSLSGEVTQAVVTRDEPTRLIVTITRKGFEGARLWGEVTGSDRKTQKVIRALSPYEVPSGPEGEVELRFELDPSAPENTPVKSTYLRICVAKSDRATASYIKIFDLPKTWLLATRPENVVVTVTPKPLGTTANLGPTPTYTAPPRAVRPDLARSGAIKLTARTAAPSAATVRAATPAPAGGNVRTVIAPSAAPAARMSATRMVAPNAVVVAKTDSASRLLSRNVAIARLNGYHFGVGQDDQKKGAKGPAAAPVEPLAQLRTEDIDLDPSHVLGVFPGFYPDQVPASGVWYFLPYSYSLRWDPDAGYDLRMIYSAAASAGQAGEVAMAARLDAGIGLKERQIATDLMAAYAKNNSLPFTALRALPIDSISVSIADDLRRYNIPRDKIAVTGLSDFLGQIDVSWLTDPVTKENLQQALIEDVGISGRVTLYPSGGALGPIDVPIQIRLADFVTFGPFRWSRAESWRNRTPYPVRLRYLNALMLDAASRPIVYSWDLANATVPPEARVQWVAGSVPGWIDSQAKRVWLEYAVDATCSSCDEQVIRSITGGVSTSGPSQITFRTITPLADAGAYEIAAQVRSRYFDPQTNQLQTKLIVLNADGRDFNVGPLYLGARQPGESIPGDPLFEYLLELTMKDGTTYKGTRWLTSDDLRLPIGKHQLEEALGALPGAH